VRRDLVTTAAVGGILLLLSGVAYVTFRQQQAATHEILSRLDDVRSTLREQSQVASTLSSQVEALTDRVGRLEADNRDLRNQIAALMRRKPLDVASAGLPTPLASNPLTPFAEHSIAVTRQTVLETLPITWAADWTAYQPAGVIAPPAPLILTRRLTDPALRKKLYYSYGALQTADAITTLVAVNRGAREVNPFLGNNAGNPLVLFGFKAATVAGTVLVIEKLRHDHPVLATVSLIALNSTLAVVAVNNVSVAARQKAR
jgi:hypothetical protein